jgi:hypothetical protein
MPETSQDMAKIATLKIKKIIRKRAFGIQNLREKSQNRKY